MSDDTPTGQDHLDEAALIELQALLEDDFTDLIETYLADARLRYRDLEQAVVSRVADDILRAAHSFKGSSLNIGALRLSSLCKRLEDHARDGRTLYARALLGDIKAELETVDRLLREHYL